MRIIPALIALAIPVATMAQTTPPGAPPNRDVITRDQFIQRATMMAGRRFDAIDVNHAGYVTREQLQAWRQAHQGQGMPVATRSNRIPPCG